MNKVDDTQTRMIFFMGYLEKLQKDLLQEYSSTYSSALHCVIHRLPLRGTPLSMARGIPMGPARSLNETSNTQGVLLVFQL